MRRSLALSLLLCLAFAAGCRPRSGGQGPINLVSWHFLGSQRVLEDTNATTLKEIWALPSTLEVQNRALDKVAGAAQSLFGRPAQPAAGDPPVLLRPLLDDLVQHESLGELRGLSNQPVEIALAVKLGADRALLWNRQLQTLAAGAVASTQTVWAVNRPAAPSSGTNFYRFTRAGEWVVFGLGRGREPAGFQALLQKVKTPAATASGASWLTLRLNLPALQPLLALPPNIEWPDVTLLASGEKKDLRMVASLRGATPFQCPLDPWKIPVHLIHDPPKNQLTGFSALRGFGPWLGRQPAAKVLGLKVVPNQLFTWTHSAIPVQTYAAVPVSGTTNLVERLAEWLPQQAPPQFWQHSPLQVLPPTNQDGLFFVGVPFTSPFFQSANTPGQEYLMAGLLPIPRYTNPPPVALLQEIARTNLLYYSWEVTAANLSGRRDIGQLASIAVRRRPLDANLPSIKWLADIEPKLGNTITLVTLKGPNELELIRRSKLGLNSPELAFVAAWLEASTFPALRWPECFVPDFTPPPASKPAKPAPVRPEARKPGS